MHIYLRGSQNSRSLDGSRNAAREHQNRVSLNSQPTHMIALCACLCARNCTIYCQCSKCWCVFGEYTPRHWSRASAMVVFENHIWFMASQRHEERAQSFISQKTLGGIFLWPNERMKLDGLVKTSKRLYIGYVLDAVTSRICSMCSKS